MQKRIFKKNIKRVVIFYRSKSRKIKRKAQEISNFLKKKNIHFDLVFQKESPAFKQADLIVCLGGDGAYLKAVKYGPAVPILGINMGSLGFLTPYEAQTSLSLLEKTLNGQMFLKKSHFIKARVYKKKTPPANSRSNIPPALSVALLKKDKQIFYAVNDIVVERGAFSRLINVSIFINKKHIYSLKSDGLIVSSPLGSTAYNLAAGGPILHPEVSSLVITPICSHSLTSRPVVIPDSSEIHLSLATGTKACLTIDGSAQSELSDQNAAVITKDKNFFLSVAEKEETGFALLRKKLKFGQRD